MTILQATIIYAIAVCWAAGVLSVFVVAVIAWFKESILAAVITILLGLPMVIILILLPFSVIDEAAKPDLVTLKRGGWACTESRRVGKIIQCDQYSRVS